MDTANLKLPDHYINRELSALEFNRRVMQQAADSNVPLLERLKFLCIVSTNLDEFFEIRVSGLKERAEAGSVPTGPDMLTPQQLIPEIAQIARGMVTQQYRLLNEELIPAMAREGIRFIQRDNWTDVQRDWLKRYFQEQVEPTLSPISLDPARPFPRILNKSLNFIVGLEGIHAFGRPCRRAIVQAPRSLPRLIRLPQHLAGPNNNDFVFLSSVIHAFVDTLFVGMEITGCFQFRVTRNSDLYVDEEEMENLMRALEGQLASSRYGAAVRLEVAYRCPEELTGYLLDVFELDQNDMYQIDGPVNLDRLMTVYSECERNDLKYPPFTSGTQKCLRNNPDMFSLLRKQDVLLHHPFESFGTVLELVQAAAKDPEVVAIKMTLYRTIPDSRIVDYLVEGASAGKEVTVLVELRARFDEATNISLANRLQEAGAHVVYGIVGFKTHCKLTLIVRQEQGKLTRYVHLGTGNYHPETTRMYTDYGLLTTNKEISDDVHQVFLQLTSMMQTPPLNRLLQAPFQLHESLLAMIDREAANASAGGNGHIVAKLNALVEPEIIRALYKASSAGVLVDLIVRGICCLRPGVPGISDNIRVRSIVGRFLEHSRIYYFYANGDEEVFCSSADWMDRSVFRRVEIAYPILDSESKARLIGDLDLYLSDNTNAWQLMPDGSYRRLSPRAGERPLSAHDSLLERLAENRQVA
ncbi:MAG: polyphosphate kinase 1 [Gammaproteobacteria bacterium]